MRTILVTGSTGIVGYGCLRALRAAEPGLRLIGTSIYENYVPNAFCDVFVKAVPTMDACYMDWLSEVVSSYHVDLIIPGIEADLYLWNQSREHIAVMGTKALLNNKRLIDLCEDKWAFAQRLAESAPEYLIPSAAEGDYEELSERFGKEFLLKPRRGFGSKGIVRVAGRQEFEAHAGSALKKGGMLMAQRLVGTEDEEYTVGAVYDESCRLCAHIEMQRTLDRQGFTLNARPVLLPGIEKTLEKLGRIFYCFGPTNFQFRREAGRLCLLEINPRISSSLSIRTAFGFNECAMGMRLILDGEPPVQPALLTGRATRYVEDYVVYDRDHL